VNDAHKQLQNFDVFVLSSLKEGFPYTILEAIAQQIPIITTNVGVTPEIIEDKKTGLIVSAGNIVELTNALIFAYKNPREIETMSENLLQLSSNKFTKEKMLEKTKTIYHLR